MNIPTKLVCYPYFLAGELRNGCINVKNNHEFKKACLRLQHPNYSEYKHHKATCVQDPTALTCHCE